MARPRLPKSVEELVHWYERYISPIGLVAGFIADNLFLTRRVDLWQTDAIFFFYLVVSAVGILLINLLEQGKVRQAFMLKLAPVVPVIVQVSFGGLFGGFLSLYSRSAAFPLSWVFVVALVALVLFNERFARFYSKFTVQMSVYFTVLFSFLIFFLPVVFRTIGPYMFVAAGVVSFVVLGVFMRTLRFFMPELVKKERTNVARSVALIFIAFNALYFLGAIPPLPLALKDAGVYHSVVHDVSSGVYNVTGEPSPWYAFLSRYNQTFHKMSGESVFVYTSIFAPSGLMTTVLDRWQYYNPASRAWITEATVSYAVEGGRDGGYEGYSEFPNPMVGSWRVDVVTQYGELIGRISFTIVNASGTPELVQTMK